MSYVSTLGFGQKQAGVRIAWPRGLGLPEDAKSAAPDHTAVGIDAGMRVQTGRGLLAAGELVEGDIVADGDNGWTQVAGVLRVSCDIGADRIEIAAGALGGGLPCAPLVVGRRARLRVFSEIAERLVGQATALVTAEALLGLDGVTLHPAALIDIVHVVFAEHGTYVAEEVVLEAFVPTASRMESLPWRHAAALYRAVPRLRYAGALAAFQADMSELDAREMRQILSGPVSFGTSPAVAEAPVLHLDDTVVVGVIPLSGARSA